jgi:CRP-like cAMP-binding protein
MAHDRVDGDELRLTHEFLGIMLGVPRPGVTIALQGLERAGVIGYRHGFITIIDREALKESTNGTYVAPSDK